MRLADRATLDFDRVDATLLDVVGVTVLALAVRIVGLGGRVMHWDEGRVAYWIMRFHETGEFSYRPIIHGPFLPVVNNYLFDVVPPSDFAARLPVAVVGGLLPLTAYLLRDRLRRSEVVALALLLAANPLLVYYSRFMRSDVLVAAFSFAAFALVVRGVDTGNVRYLYPAAASFALGLTAKENGFVYAVTFLGALALLFDHHLVRRTRAADAPAGEALKRTLRDDYVRTKQRLSARAGDVRTGALQLLGHAAAAVVVFLAVIVFFYAPRPEFWTAVGDPAQFPGVVEEATLGSWEKFSSVWASGAHRGHDYGPFLFDLVETIVYSSSVLAVFALVGFVVDGYTDGSARSVVSFATYWGAASLVGYPVATDIQAPWAAVHVVLPFAVPAAVGAAAVYRTARNSLSAGDSVGTTIAALVILSAAVGVVGANATYVNSSSQDTKQVLQWAQPDNDLKRSLQKVETIAPYNEGTDVLYYGTCNPGGGCDLDSSQDALFYVKDEDHPLRGPAWHSRLPLPWYMEAYGATVDSSAPSTSAAEALESPPPVVIAYSWNRSDVAAALPPRYEAHVHDFKLWGEEIVVFVDRETLRAARRAERPGATARPGPGLAPDRPGVPGQRGTPAPRSGSGGPRVGNG